mmetsp:Transcript_47271/g.54467  ORF Transcript_47271/g.54467 Transcript_47271/m.54467 type:complete len:130 (+) Transcript_47271:328-717(+)
MPRRSSNCPSVPCSTMAPLSTTQMLSQFLIVSSRWAMVSVVFPCDTFSSADWINFSDLLSRALVASSKRRILGFDTMARAMAIRCFWPPDSLLPPRPTMRSYFSGALVMKSSALASRAASSIWSSVASG